MGKGEMVGGFHRIVCQYESWRSHHGSKYNSPKDNGESFFPAGRIVATKLAAALFDNAIYCQQIHLLSS